VVRVRVALGLEMLRAPIAVERVKFRRLSINGDLPHVYLGSNIVPIPEQLISIASQPEVRREPVCNLFYTLN
jgi:hypothetical protein